MGRDPGEIYTSPLQSDDRPELALRGIGDTSAREQQLFRMAQSNPIFINDWQMPERREEIKKEVRVAYADPEAASRALAVVSYIGLRKRQDQEGAVARWITRIEKTGLWVLHMSAIKDAEQKGLL